MSMVDGIKVKSLNMFEAAEGNRVRLTMYVDFQHTDKLNFESSATFTKIMPANIFADMVREDPDWKQAQTKSGGWTMLTNAFNREIGS
jgi:hypothetical protein